MHTVVRGADDLDVGLDEIASRDPEVGPFGPHEIEHPVRDDGAPRRREEGVM
jgi:hypothetical protein